MAKKELVQDPAPTDYPYVTFLARNCRATVYDKQGVKQELVRDELRHVRIQSDQNLVNIQNALMDNQKDYALVGFGNLPEGSAKGAANFHKCREQLPRMIRPEMLKEYEAAPKAA